MKLSKLLKLSRIQYILIAVLVVALVASARLAYSNYKFRSITARLNEQLMEANLEVGRAKTKFENANKHIKSLEQQVQKEVKARKAVLTRIGWFRGRLRTAKKIIKGAKGKIVYLKNKSIKAPKGVKYETGMVYQAISPKILMPLDNLERHFSDHRLDAIVSVKPTPNLDMEIPTALSYRLRLSFRGEIAETLLPSGGRNFYLNIYETHQGRDIGKIKLDSFDVIINDERKAGFMFAPHLDLGVLPFWDVQGRRVRVGGSFGISAFGFGLTKNDLAWRFLRLSVDIQESIGAGLSPVLVNMGQYLPLISNIYVAPHFSYFLNRHMGFGLFLGSVI